VKALGNYFVMVVLLLCFYPIGFYFMDIFENIFFCFSQKKESGAVLEQHS